VRPKISVVALALAVGLLFAWPLRTVHAKVYWTGVSGDWHDPSNWTDYELPLDDPDRHRLPTASDAAIFDNTYIWPSPMVAFIGGGAAAAEWLYLGLGAAGAVTQTGGSLHVAGVLLGAWPTSEGSTYDLSGNGLIVAGETQVGGGGSGLFINRGGVHTITGNLSLGVPFGSKGIYQLDDDLLDAGFLTVNGQEAVGFEGKGVFSQLGGKHTIGTHLLVGAFPGSDGRYELGGGSLTTNDAAVGDGGTGVFSHVAGAHVVENSLLVGNLANSNGEYEMTRAGAVLTVRGNLALGWQSGSLGTFNLRKGEVRAQEHEIIGFDGTGRFDQTGGTNSVGKNLYIRPNITGTGTYLLRGGLASVGGYVSNNGLIEIGNRNDEDYNSCLRIQGDYEQTEQGKLAFKMGPNELIPKDIYDDYVYPIVVSGVARLHGTLEIQRADGFQVAAGDRFGVMRYGDVRGRFSTFKGSQIDDDRFFGLNYRKDSLEVITLNTPKRVTAPGGSTLVLVTHGWNGFWGQSEKHQLVTDLAGHIRDSSSPFAGVDVMTFFWNEYAGNRPWLLIQDAREATQIGHEIGESLGNWLVETRNLEGKTHLHLLSHSGGSWLVDAVADVLRQKCPGVVIHLTLLDTFDQPGYPLIYGAPLGPERPVLGESADWAEQYVSMDWLPWTNSTLPKVFNVDVDALGKAGQSPDHLWPFKWYIMTVQDPTNGYLSSGWGFSRSYEFAAAGLPSHDTYPRGNNPPLVLLPYGRTAFLPSCGAKINFFATSNVASDTGTVTIEDDGSGFTMATDSPVWLTTFVDLSEQANFMRFDFAFLSDNDGLLTVWADGNEIFRVDETAVPDNEFYSTGFFWLDQTLDVGTHTLLFRLDSFGTTQSVVSISDVEFAYAEPVPEPATLALLVLGGLALLPRRRSTSS